MFTTTTGKKLPMETSFYCIMLRLPIVDRVLFEIILKKAQTSNKSPPPKKPTGLAVWQEGTKYTHISKTQQHVVKWLAVMQSICDLQQMNSDRRNNRPFSQQTFQLVIVGKTQITSTKALFCRRQWANMHNTKAVVKKFFLKKGF